MRQFYFESLVEQFPTLFVDAAEAKNLVYFNYLDEKDWGKLISKSLSRFISFPLLPLTPAFWHRGIQQARNQ